MDVIFFCKLSSFYVIAQKILRFYFTSAMVFPYRAIHSMIEMWAVDLIAIDAVPEIVPETIAVVII